jgi:hypothetical protein
MMNLTIPVSPYIGELDGVSDVVLSLAGTAPARHIKLTAEVPTAPEYERATLQLESTELQTMADIGFSGGAEIRAKAGAKVYFFMLDKLYQTSGKLALQLFQGNDRCQLRPQPGLVRVRIFGNN